ncbi:MAG: hypothetical protein IID46_16585, partial [Planctomycetes bacterium]|nr:hypothetical protein [Planctomycetota bacterium]
MSLGLVFGAVAAGGAWKLIPAPYTAFSEIRILSVDPKFFYPVDDGTPVFTTYKQTEMRLVRSPYVLLEAIRDPAIAKISTIRDQERPVNWLEKKLSVGSPAVEFIRISLSGSNPVHLKEIVEAVTKSYLKEVVDKDNLRRRQRLNQLEKVHSTENAVLETMQSSYRELSEETQTANSPQRNQRQAHLLDTHLLLRGQLARITMDRINAEIELKVRDTA